MSCLLIYRSPERKARRIMNVGYENMEGIVSPGLRQYFRHARYVPLSYKKSSVNNGKPAGLRDDN